MCTMTHPEDLVAGEKYCVLHHIDRERCRAVAGKFVSLITIRLELYVRLEIRNAFVDVAWKSITKIEAI